MRAKAGFIRGIMLAGVLLAPLAFAVEETQAKLGEQCKKEAQENGIHPSDIAAYVSECLSDYGVEAADVKKIMEQMKLNNQNDN